MKNPSESPLILHTIADIKEWRSSISNSTRVGFVPTMGALHEGHATLLRALRPKCEISVLSIFINPTQFGPQEDLSRYPKTFERDLAIAKQEHVDVVFAPTPEQIYPADFSTFVEETHLSQPLCGPFRPGHFQGVTTVVLKLFNLIRPNLALFGLKDAQQFFVIDRMVKDLNLDIQVEGIPTIREPDGLALSSRNAFLSEDERKKAPLLYQALLNIKTALDLPAQKSLQQVLEEAKALLTQNTFRVQYLELLQLPSFKPFESDFPSEVPHLIAGACYLGKTRLIDNIITSPYRRR